jgi:D-xylose transport system substrate-binding protein
MRRERDMSVKRWGASVALVGLLAVWASACGSSSSDNSSTSSTGSSGGSGGAAKIALLLPESKTTRYEHADKPLFEKAVKAQCPSCDVIYANAEQDPAKQQQQAEQALTNGAKVLVIDAVDVRSATAIATRAKQKDVPVVSYGRLVADADLDAYVSIDPYRVGVQQGQALLRALADRPQRRVIMINGSPTDSNSAPYRRGAHSVLDPAGVKVVKEYDTPDWSPDRAQTEMEQAITAVGKTGYDGVYSANDGMATGVVAAERGQGIDPRTIPLTGQDAEVDGLQRIITGDQTMSVYQPIARIASIAAQLAVPLAQGRTPPATLTPSRTDNGRMQVPSALVDTIVITRGNIMDPVVRDGYATVAQICTSAYKAACDAAGIR